MDSKKIIKDFIIHICDWVENEYKNKEHDSFAYDIRNDKMSYLIADKGIEKRIEKQLFKRFGLKSSVKYTLEPSMFEYLNGEIKIKIIKSYISQNIEWNFGEEIQ